MDRLHRCGPCVRRVVFSVSRPTLLRASEAISVSHQPRLLLVGVYSAHVKWRGAKKRTGNPGLGLLSAPTCFVVVYTLH